GAALLGPRDGRPQHLVEPRHVADEVIGGEDDEGGVGVEGVEARGGEGDAGGRVPRGRLGEDVLGREGGEVLPRLRRVVRVRDDEDALGGDERLQPRERVLDQRRRAEDVEELLGVGAAAARPEPAADAAGHDDGVEGHEKGGGGGSGAAEWTVAAGSNFWPRAPNSKCRRGAAHQTFTVEAEARIDLPAPPLFLLRTPPPMKVA